MKRFCISVALLLGVTAVSAVENCQKLPMVNVYINGIYTEQVAAAEQGFELSEKSGDKFYLVYNRTNGKITDLWEVLKLKLAEQKTEVKNNFNLEKFIEKLNEDPAKSITKIAAGSQEWSDQLLGDMYVEAHKVAQKITI